MFWPFKSKSKGRSGPTLNLENLSYLVEKGRLDEALQSVTKIEDTGGPEDQFALFGVCLLIGEIERAERALGHIAAESPDVAEAIELCRGLLQSESWRQAWRADAGRRPSAFANPPEFMKLQCKAWHQYRTGDKDGAVATLQEAVELRPSVTGEIRLHNGERFRFDDIADADGFSEGTIEILGPKGFYLLPWCDLESIEMEEPANLLEAVLMPANLRSGAGVRGMVWIPVLYAGSHADDNGDVRTGNATKWTWIAEGVGVGAGQRTIRLLPADQEEEAGIELPWKAVRSITIDKCYY